MTRMTTVGSKNDINGGVDDDDDDDDVHVLVLLVMMTTTMMPVGLHNAFLMP